MNKLFTRLLIASASAFASFFAACSEQNPGWLTGTAEERNQSAYADPPSGNIGPASSSDIESSSAAQDPVQKSSASDGKTGHSGHPDSTIHIIVVGNSSSSVHGISIPKSSSSQYTSISNGNEVGVVGGHVSSSSAGNIGSVDEYYLSTYVKKSMIPDISFADEVFGINKTYNSEMDYGTDSPSTAEFRTLGLHKAESNNLADISNLFPETTKRWDPEIKNLFDNGCFLYVLNISSHEPMWFILSSISKDSLVINQNISTCSFYVAPFSVGIGFLFSSCEELSEKPQIIINELQSKIGCTSYSHEEYYKQK